VRIVVDGRMLGWTGIGRYTRRLIDELVVVDPELELVLLVGPAGTGDWRPPDGAAAQVRTSARPHRPREQVALPLLLRRQRPDLVHFPHFSVPVAYRGPFVVTVHDLTLLRYPARPGRSPATVARRHVKQRVGRATMGWAVRHAAVVLTPSQHTADDVVDTFGVDPAKVVAVPNGVDPPSAEPVAVPAVDPQRPFVLYVGNCHPHKNVGVVVDAVARLAASGRADLRLVLAGPGGPWTDRLCRQVRDRGLDERVQWTGPVSDAQLAWLYRHASVLVQPSLAEGFGFTGLEAMASGLPVVAARSSCLPEVYGDAACWFDPTDANDLADRLVTLLGDPARRGALVAAGAAQAARYRWRTTAETVAACYRQAARAASRPQGRAA